MVSLKLDTHHVSKAMWRNIDVGRLRTDPEGSRSNAAVYAKKVQLR